MLGKRRGQRKLFAADHLDVSYVGEDSIYAFFARHHAKLFRDEDFSALYRSGGRPSVPPSMLAIALILQRKHRLSDQGLVDAMRYDLRFKVALQLEHHEGLCAKSTVQTFRAGLIIHELDQFIFERTIAIAEETGLVNTDGIDLVLDTTPMLGAGAVKDSVNLIGDGISKLLRALARLANVTLAEQAAELELARYVDESRSLKAAAEIDWQDPEARKAFIASVVDDADRLLAIAKTMHGRLQEAGREAEAAAVEEAAGLLCQLLAQDIERDADGRGVIKKGTALDRVVSVHDPEMRHGRKSSSVRFEGHKTAIAVDGDSGIIVDCDVLPGNESDHATALETTERVEERLGITVDATIADGAYGSAATRAEFAEADRVLIAKLPRDPSTTQFPKSAFTIDLEQGEVTCPAGQTTRRKEATTIVQRGTHIRTHLYRFDPATCAACPLKAHCTEAASRTVRIHPHEAVLQQARVDQATPTFRERYRKRSIVEHVNARLVQLDVRQSRYVGRRKSLFQLLLAAATANLTRILSVAGRSPAFASIFVLLTVLYTLLQRLVAVFDDNRPRRLRPSTTTSAIDTPAQITPFRLFRPGL